MKNPMTREPLTEAELYAAFEKSYAAMRELNAAYRSDEELRRRIDGGDAASAMEAFGLDMPPGLELRVAADTAEVFHVVLPPDPNSVVADSALPEMAGGSGTASSASTVSSAGSFGCSTSPSTLSSAGSAGSGGTAT